MPYIDNSGNYYDGDRQYSIINGELIWDIEVTIKPIGKYIPIITDGVFISWQLVPKTKVEKLTDLKSLYQPALDLLKDNMLAAMGIDGTIEVTKKQTISDQYKIIYAEYTAERKLIT